MRSFFKGFTYIWLLVFLIVVVGLGVIFGPRLLREYRFARYGKPKAQENPFITGSEELKSCMKQVIGERAFSAIAQDKRPPTKKEQEKLEACWPALDRGQATGAQFAEESEETKACLRKAIGSPAFEEISQGQRAPTAKEEELLRACFDQPQF